MSPAGGIWQVINSQIVVTREFRQTKGSITSEINCREAVAFVERIDVNEFDAAAHRDVSQTGAKLKSTGSDGGDTVWDYYAGYSGFIEKIEERRVPNAGDRQAINRAWNDHSAT